MRGALGRGGFSAEGSMVRDSSDGSCRGSLARLVIVALESLLTECCGVETPESPMVVDATEAIDDRVELDDCRSECASVYLTVVMSSSNGVRKDTRFWAGNMGREGAILRGILALLARMETRLCGCLYGTARVAEWLDEAEVRAEESVEAEVGVERLLEAGKVLSMQRRGFEGRSRAGAGVGAGEGAWRAAIVVVVVVVVVEFVVTGGW